jgi:hypothetical protein
MQLHHHLFLLLLLLVLVPQLVTAQAQAQQPGVGVGVATQPRACVPIVYGAPCLGNNSLAKLVWHAWPHISVGHMVMI